jgi:hypothetical protein
MCFAGCSILTRRKPLARTQVNKCKKKGHSVEASTLSLPYSSSRRL